MLFLAGHRAGVTADAAVLVDGESVAHDHSTRPFLFLPLRGLAVDDAVYAVLRI